MTILFWKVTTLMQSLGVAAALAQESESPGSQRNTHLRNQLNLLPAR